MPGSIVNGHPTRLSRRRMLVISAAMSIFPGGVQASQRVHKWRGSVMGARAGLDFYGASKKAAQEVTVKCLAEVDRLEKVFSLFRADSEISRLNRQGEIRDASQDMRILLAQARSIGRASAGAFDPTIQALWQLNTSWFARYPGSSGPTGPALMRMLKLVDYRKITQQGGRINLGEGQAITLNGIAQGYITDQIAALLKADGWQNVLVALGEYFALDRKGDGQPFRLALKETDLTIDLANEGLASSSSSGFMFPAARPEHHTHLFVPDTGKSPQFWGCVHVRNAQSVLADGLSTAFSCMKASEIEKAVQKFPGTTAWAVPKSGTTMIFES